MDWNKIIGVFRYDPASPMLFNSGIFLVMFLGFYGIYVLIRDRRTFLFIYTVLFSLYFYYKASGFYVTIFIASTIINFWLGNRIFLTENKAGKKAWLISGIILNLALLFYFKYTNLFLRSWGTISGSEVPHLDIFLPIGISFFTFQSISYLVDIYKKLLRPPENLLNFSFYATFFPHLVAGPIVRAYVFLPQIYQKLKLTVQQIGQAWWLIIAGLIKKAVISDYISINFVDRVFDNPALYSGFENLMAVYGYAIQIYCDFSGYSDIAIGLALLMGFRLPINFNSPYKATSVTDFWRRWHITLSTWLRDYLYIPMGGNRKGKLRTYSNLLMTMLIGGLWHGASWKFVVWGGLHGTALAVEKLFQPLIGDRKSAWLRVAGWILTFHFVCLGWIFFRAADYSIALAVIKAISGFSGWDIALEIITTEWPVFLVLALGYAGHFFSRRYKLKLEEIFSKSPLPVQALAVSLVIWIILQVASAQVQPFIYFQF
ncbi:MAG: MBOAT family protein [Bacteroidales bacterium]|jgi:D-alanyl-lipoteichoic acid acyltransferase DltB (MBOAT superfamily)|nr:MBOAT family protein [Bacteroidales bacterium]